MYSSESGVTELDRQDTSFNQSVVKFIKSDRKINYKFEISHGQILKQIDFDQKSKLFVFLISDFTNWNPVQLTKVDDSYILEKMLYP